MRTLTEAEKCEDLLAAVRTLPRSLCKDPAAVALLLAEHPRLRRWMVEVPDPMKAH